MHKTTLNLAAIIAAALLTACDGGSDDAIVPAPAQPTATETAAFDASKQFRTDMIILDGEDYPPLTINANGRTLVRAYGNKGSAFAEGDLRSLPSGFSSITGTGTINGSNTTMPVTIRSYQGFRSGITIVNNANGVSVVNLPYGIRTPPVSTPTAGKATYTGTVFYQNRRGSLTYNVDFSTKSGEGRIDGLDYHGTITLAKSNFGTRQMLDGNTVTGIAGTASTTDGVYFSYSLGFCGDHAEEMSGIAVNISLEGIGFHGTRGAITE